MPTVYNKVTANNQTLIDLSQDTVSSANHIRSGYTAHLNDGTTVTGSYTGTTPTLVTKSITANGTYAASSDNADGYSSVTVIVSGSSKNVQTNQSTSRTTSTSLTSLNSLTCSTAGTYDVYWTCTRSSTGGTWSSRLYVGGSASGSEQTTWSNHVQTVHLTNVTISKDATVAVYAKSRGSNYYAYAPQLTIVQSS